MKLVEPLVDMTVVRTVAYLVDLTDRRLVGQMAAYLAQLMAANLVDEKDSCLVELMVEYLVVRWAAY